MRSASWTMSRSGAEAVTALGAPMMARPAGEVLAWSRRMVEPALRAAVQTLPASTRHIAGYHCGWWDAHGRPTPAGGGKALRPALVLTSAAAWGGGSALPAAAAVELVHNFSLLHDDVMDGDRTRRHRATAWHVFGASAAILTGDALLSLALDQLAGSGHPAAGVAIRMLNGAVQRLLDGQHADLAFEARSDVAIPECLSMAAAKTGALLGCACALGGLLGGGAPDQVERLGRFGEDLGLAFQFVDDDLGIWGDPAATGKPVHSDVRSRKKTLPVVAALCSRTAAGRELAVLYRDGQPLTDDAASRAAALVERAGGRGWSQSQAEHLLARALRHLATAALAPVVAAELEALARLATRRDR
jgi:geranylgeranyl diphosphate synthase, type I